MGGFFDSLGSNLINALSWVLELLPDSPFQAISNSDVNQFMGTLNWFLPMSQIIAELELWITCVSVFYVYQLILRWIRAIE
jgi:hypothetical protein